MGAYRKCELRVEANNYIEDDGKAHLWVDSDFRVYVQVGKSFVHIEKSQILDVICDGVRQSKVSEWESKSNEDVLRHVGID